MKKILATPKAKKYAKEQGIRLETVRGSGEFGSVRYQDLLSAKRKTRITSVAKRMAEYYHIDTDSISFENDWIKKSAVLKYANMAEVMPLTSKRKTIANNIMQSINNAAQYTLFAELDTTDFISYYRKQKQTFQKEGLRLTFTDCIIAVLATALMLTKKLNSALIGDKIYHYNYVNLSLAIADKDGLVAPVIHGANMMTLKKILSAREDLVLRTQNTTLKPDDFNGGTFTLSNLGNSNITYFTPIINYPQSAILGVGRTEQKPVVAEGEIVIRDHTYFSLTLDHLILDGKDGADFFEVLQKVMLDPDTYIEE